MRKKRKAQVLWFPSGKPVPLRLQRHLLEFEIMEIERPPLWQDIGGLDSVNEDDDGRAA